MTDYECPSCGCQQKPTEIVRCAERITFYVCPQNCGFSTWDLWEYEQFKRNKKRAN